MDNRIRLLRPALALLVMATTASVAVSQDLPKPNDTPLPYVVSTDVRASGPGLVDFGRGNPGYLNGTHDFDRFIGFMSNPIQSIDPRAITAVWPVFGSGWASGTGPLLAETNMQVYGAGLYLALSERLSVGMNQGGYVVMHAESDRERRLAQLGLPVSERDRGGQRQGWVNLGGFVQYTLVADVENQFLFTAGMRWEAPSGATQVFQGGASPTYLSPYMTAGKAFGCWHVLAIAGFEFPAGTDEVTTNTFYLNVHIDRQIGWLYPLVEFNGMYHTRTIDASLPTRHGVVDLGTFSSTSNILTVAVGANAILIQNRLEFGACYVRPVTAQDRFDFNALLVKMVYRY